MLKFIKHHVDTIVGIEIFPLISFVIFFLFFVLMTIWIIRMDKGEVKRISEIPLKNENSEQP
ncbi:MAG: CcoQ/FixQ family Cbb3-type cytochrome c oxidase assembly chaperone [Candidatus Cyclobacteriaceae bacterium M2_1C_046]